MYAAAWLGIAKKRAHESLCVKSRAEYEGPMGASIGPFASISNQRKGGQGALEMRGNDRSKPGSALLKRAL